MARERGARVQFAAVRKAAGYTQEELADALHVDRTTVARWETGDRTPLPYRRPQLARLLGRNREQLGVLLDAREELAGGAEPLGGSSALAWLIERVGWSPDEGRRRHRAAAARLDAATARTGAVHRSRVPRSAVAARLDEFYGVGPLDEGAGLYTAVCDGHEVDDERRDPPGVGRPLVVTAGRRRATLAVGSGPPARLDAATSAAALARLVRADRLGHRVHDAPIFRLESLDVVEGRPSPRFGTSTFLEYACTADLLEPELLDGLADGRDGALPLRERHLPDLASVLDPSSRLCAGGVLALCAIARPPDRPGEPGDYALVLQRRSGTVLNAAEQRAVIPKGFHQPLADPGRDVALGATLLREMEEELFGRSDVDTTETTGIVAAPMHRSRMSEPMRWLVDSPTDTFRVECTGVGFNLVSGNYEFAALVVIEDGEFWRRFGGHIEASWEASGVELVSSRDCAAVAEIATDERWNNESLFAFLLGLHRLGTIVENRPSESSTRTAPGRCRPWKD